LGAFLLTLVAALAALAAGASSEPGSADPLARAGAVLFRSPELLGGGHEPVSCATCHPRGQLPIGPARGGLVDEHGNLKARFGWWPPAGASHLPVLAGAHGPYGARGAESSLELYIAKKAATDLGGEELPPLWRRALAAYVSGLEPPPNKNLEPDGRLAKAANAAARRGERAFGKPRSELGGRSCASCHIASSDFADGRVHRRPSGALVRTPTLRGLALSAPYFHDGGAPDLKAAVAAYQRGYGLQLGASERADLVAYLEAVGAVDASPATALDDLAEAVGDLGVLEASFARDDRKLCELVFRGLGRSLSAIGNAGPLGFKVEGGITRAARLEKGCAQLDDEEREREARRLRADLERLLEELR